LFDSELVSTPGEWIRVAVPAFAAALSAAVLIAPMYQQKYKLAKAEYRAVLNSPERLLEEVRFDEQSIITLLMVLTATLTALSWQSLFPSLRDALALASLPVKPRQIFIAKFTAFTLLFAVYALALALPMAGVFTSITGHLLPGRAVHLLTTLVCWWGACAFVFFSLLVLQGILLNLLPASLFRRVSVWVQALVFGGSIAAIPLFSLLPSGGVWWPPAWFSSLWAALVGLPGARATQGLAALLGSPVAAVAVYAISYHRYRTLLLETPLQPEQERGRWRNALIRRLIPDPREQAMLTFILQSLLRSRTHQFLLLALAALAVSLNIRVVSDTVDPTRELQYSVVFGPVVMAVVAVAGLRYLFALPAELRANWLFRLTEREGRQAWMRAVERFVLCFGVAVPFVSWFPVAVWSLGIGALIAYLQGVVFVLLLFESLFRRWRKAPFTCSYLPGKQPMWKGFIVFFYSSWALGAAAGIFLAGVYYPPVFFLSITVLTLLWDRARRRRLREWAGRPLLFEEAPDADVEPIELGKDAVHELHPARHDEPEEQSWLEASDGETRPARAWRWLRDAPGDLLYALRTFRQKPMFPLGAVITIALGLGLNSAFFAIYDAFYLKKAAVRDPDSLYEYAELLRDPNDARRQVGPYQASVRQFDALRSRKDVIVEALGRYPLMVRHGERILVGWLVTGNYFSMLGGRASLGRLIGPQDNGPVMVLSHRAWKSRFGAASGVLGRSIEVRRLRYTIVGVAAPEFTGVATDREPDFWVPVASWQPLDGTREPESLAIVVRLKPNLTVEQAKGAVVALARENRKDRFVWAVELRSAATIAGAGNIAEFTFLIFLTFAFTMAIPCANVANMMLARGIDRQRELGVRLALGASRGRLVRQLLAEAVVVAMCGGVAGFFVARVALDLALRTLYSTLPWLAFLRFFRIPDLAVDQRVFLYMLAMAAVTSVSFALLPALESVRWGASFALRREVAGVRSSWLRDALVVAQVAVCLMLITCSALLLRGTSRFTRTNPGFDPADLHAVATLDWRVSPEVERLLGEQPWVRGVARSASMPTELHELSVQALATGREFRLRHNTVSAGYLELLGIPIVQGRGFTPGEAAAKAAVAVVSEAAARLLWPRETALDKVVRIDPRGVRGVLPKTNEFLVIGVTRDRALQEGRLVNAPRIYFPDSAARLAIVRGRGGTRQTVAHLERLLAEIKTETGLEVAISMEDILYFENYTARAGLWVAAVLGVVALILTASGMYAVMSFLAGQRTRELSIRVALGATRAKVSELMVRYSARLVAAGLTIGVILSLWAAKLIATRTVYVAVYDVPAYAAGLALVGLVAVAAAIPPAIRASRADPMVALRLE
jgi:predicted permease